MTESLKRKCDLFVENYRSVSRFARWEYGMMYQLCAYLYTCKGKRFDPARVDECRRIIKKNESPFSQFRNALSLSYASELSLEDDPAAIFVKAQRAYAALRERFPSSAQLPLAAIALAKGTDDESFEEAVLAAREIYDRMKDDHPFLTGSDDIPFAVLFAIAKKSPERVCTDAEQAYEVLSKRFFNSNALQSVSHCLAVGEDSLSKARRLVLLWEEFKTRRHRYGTDLELVALAALAWEQGDIVGEVIEVSDYLKGKKGFGNWSFGGQRRLMCAASLVGIERGAGDGVAIAGANQIMLEQAVTVALMAVMAAQATNTAANS